MHYQNQQRKKFKIKFQLLLILVQILPDDKHIPFLELNGDPIVPNSALTVVPT